jgi:type I restriction enzyme S subunit
LLSLSSGAGRVRISKKNLFEKFSFLLPENPKEQQKIASCFSSLDEVIAAHSQKLNLLKDHKKGMMQNLFPQEGEKVPKYRFKEFENDGEWVENSLEEVATFLKGKGISKADIVENGNLPCIRYGELYTHYNETISAIKSYTNSNINNLVLSEANDVIIPASGETQIDIATSSCVIVDYIGLEENTVSFNVYPNPTNGALTFDASEAISGVEIYGMDGKLALSATTTNVDITSLPNGIYHYSVMTVSGKVLKGKVSKI